MKIRNYNDFSENGIVTRDLCFLKKGMHLFNTGHTSKVFPSTKEYAKPVKTKAKRLHDSSAYNKEFRPEYWEKVKERARAFTRRQKGITLWVEDIERQLWTEIQEIYRNTKQYENIKVKLRKIVADRYQEEHNLTQKQVATYAMHLMRRHKKQSLDKLSLESIGVNFER